jgi:parallel beta-helix repeat protein
MRAVSTKEHLVDKLSELEVVAKLPSTYFYDEKAKVVYIHTSDDKPPKTHEIELMHRSDGIVVSGKHFVTIVGFTVRHTADAGIRFWEGAGDGIAIDNTSYGCRQGIRVYGATNVLVYGNTLFRNENAGVYFAKQAINGHTVGNTLYENVKGARWSSDSVNGLAAGNVAFDNLEAGVSVENAANVRVVGNRLVRNKRAQLLAIGVRPLADGNCFESAGPGQYVAEYTYTGYDGLAVYQQRALRDHGSRQGDCGPLPEKLDVRKLHEQTTNYAENARKTLARERERRDPKSPR